jgi:hypothetical protein
MNSWQRNRSVVDEMVRDCFVYREMEVSIVLMFEEGTNVRIFKSPKLSLAILATLCF